jgi:hypothetical protein
LFVKYAGTFPNNIYLEPNSKMTIWFTEDVVITGNIYYPPVGLGSSDLRIDVSEHKVVRMDGQMLTGIIP